MEFIRNLKIAGKLKVLIVLTLVLLICVGMIGLTYTNSANSQIEELYNQNLISVKDLGIIKGNFIANNSELLEIISSNSTATKHKYINKIEARTKQNAKVMEEYNQIKKNDDVQSLFKEVAKYRLAYRDSRDIVIKIALTGNNQAASNYYHKETTKTLEAYTKSLDNLIELNANAAEKTHSQNKAEANQARIILILTILLSSAFFAFIGMMISNMITKPIEHIVSELTHGANEVASTSNQLSNASEQLASGSTQQAEAVQEISASIEESESMVKQNTDNTQQAANIAKTAKSYATQSVSTMNKMMGSISELKTSSDEIGKIIKVIDDIAFQTNILALNAAVEAARAGDAGKGFAVVAEEVRQLAQKSAQATKDTAKIIEQNISLSNENVNLTQNVNENIKQIDTESQKVSGLMDEISVASKEQYQGIEQITKAIKQMELIIQSNATHAEESAEASRELSSQADRVKEIVNMLITMIDGH